MTKKRNTRRALLASILSMIMCMTMLIGSTFAWFTDNASTAVNTIQAGTLDILLLDENGKDITDETLYFYDENGNKDVLFEPGVTFRTNSFKIHQNGNLEFKYKIKISGIEGDADLLEVVEFSLIGEDGNVIEQNHEGRSTDFVGTNQDSELMYIQAHMKGDAGNEYQGLSIEGCAITVLATQLSHEYDSNGNTYDSNATYDEVIAVTAQELQKILKDFADAGSGNNTIQLTTNYELKEGESWEPITIDGYHGAGVITIEGNGMTISGLDAPLFAGGFAGKSGIIIKDLTISDSKIVSSNDVGSGAFIESIDSMEVITLENCHVKDSTISGSRTGGLIGWNSGYNNVNDGAVETFVTIENCSVVNCQITGAGTVGGIIGHAGANAWTWNTIKNCKVEGCTLTSNDDSYRVGAIVGTANVGEVVMEGCESINNTIKQNNNGTEIARPANQSELYGRFVPGTTGKLTIDGVAIN